jgi:hypothetical protein
VVVFPLLPVMAIILASVTLSNSISEESLIPLALIFESFQLS